MSNCLLFACLPRRQIFLSCNVLKKYRAVLLDIKIISCNSNEIYLLQHKSVGIRISRFLKNIERKRASTRVFYPDIRHMGQARRFQAPQHLFIRSVYVNERSALTRAVGGPRLRSSNLNLSLFRSIVCSKTPKTASRILLTTGI